MGSTTFNQRKSEKLNKIMSLPPTFVADQGDLIMLSLILPCERLTLRPNYTERQKKLITSSGQCPLKSTLSKLIIFAHK